MEKDTVNTKMLDKLIKDFGNEMPVIKIGIFGNQQRAQGKKTNAEIGIIHEFGTENIEQRSFLRQPLTEQFDSYLKEAGIISKDSFKKMMKENDKEPLVMKLAKKLALVAETIVADAFDSGGFGKWKPSDMSKKENHQTLVETQQLRDSISTEIK